jgi:hypothetical protein
LCLSSAGFDGGFQLPLSRLLEQGGASVLGLELDRWNEADLAVEPVLWGSAGRTIIRSVVRAGQELAVNGDVPDWCRARQHR